MSNQRLQGAPHIENLAVGVRHVSSGWSLSIRKTKVLVYDWVEPDHRRGLQTLLCCRLPRSRLFPPSLRPQQWLLNSSKSYFGDSTFCLWLSELESFLSKKTIAFLKSEFARDHVKMYVLKMYALMQKASAGTPSLIFSSSSWFWECLDPCAPLRKSSSESTIDPIHGGICISTAKETIKILQCSDGVQHMIPQSETP